jgi:hypothetical protein
MSSIAPAGAGASKDWRCPNRESGGIGHGSSGGLRDDRYVNDVLALLAGRGVGVFGDGVVADLAVATAFRLAASLRLGVAALIEPSHWRRHRADDGFRPQAGASPRLVDIRRGQLLGTFGIPSLWRRDRGTEAPSRTQRASVY